MGVWQEGAREGAKRAGLRPYNPGWSARGGGRDKCVSGATTETETRNFSLSQSPPSSPPTNKDGGSPKVIKPELQVSDR